jgi:hypothetical protein
LRAEVFNGQRQIVGAKNDAKMLVRQNPVFGLRPHGVADASAGRLGRCSRGGLMGRHSQKDEN